MHFHFSTVVWGEWHTGVFLDVNLPSLLAPDNLSAFVERFQVQYRIFTSPESARQIAQSPAFRRASEIVKFELIECKIDRTTNPIGMHHLLWNRSIDEAKSAGAMILFVPPDVIWANGALRHVAEIAQAGKRAIFMTYMRVVSETCVPEARRRHLAADGAVLDAQPRELVELAMQYIHPLTLTYMRDSENFPVHPEFVLWPVAGEGMLMRVLVREMFAYDPAMFELNRQALLAHPPDRDLVHYITDSDDLFALSLAPLRKDIDWYAHRRPLDVARIAQWWLTYDSPGNDVVAAEYFHVHRGDRTPALWRRAELQSDVLIQRVQGAREVLRTLTSIDHPAARHALRIGAMALIETRLARRVHAAQPFTLLVPQNDAILRWLLAGGETILASPRALLRVILGHIVIGRLDLRRGEDTVLRTLAGTRRQLSWENDAPRVDDVPLSPEGFRFAGKSYQSSNTGYLLDGVLT